MSESMNGIIGSLDWAGCDGCKHDDYHKGCLVESEQHGEWPVRVDGDFVYCQLFEEATDE